MRRLRKITYIFITLIILTGFAAIVPGDTWLSRTEDTMVSELEEDQGIAVQDTWVSGLMKQIAIIDENVPGTLGVFIKDLDDGNVLSFNAEDYWYLSSTIKVPVAIAVLQRVETGELSLDDELTLRESDKVDGAGDLLWQEPGSKHTIASLLEKMIKNSDSTATDMLIRLIGEDEFNEQIRKKMVQEGFNHITTILQVRYDAYSEFHENISDLTNMDIIYAHSTFSRQERLNRLLEKMSISENDLDATSIQEAFERYYGRGLNSAKLESFGLLLERLYNRELLSEEHTEYLLEIMEKVTTGDSRIKAGLPQGTRFAQKTGTQIESACNAGIIFPKDNNGNRPVILVVCLENFGNINEAEKAMEITGRMVTETLLQKNNANN